MCVCVCVCVCVCDYPLSTFCTCVQMLHRLVDQLQKQFNIRIGLKSSGTNSVRVLYAHDAVTGVPSEQDADNIGDATTTTGALLLLATVLFHAHFLE